MIQIAGLFPFAVTWVTRLKILWQFGAEAICTVVALYLVFLLFRFVAPKVAAIAKITTKEALSQPLFYVLIAVGIFALVVFLFLPYHTFGEDVKMVKSSGLTLIKVLAIVLALWMASVSVAEEIEGRTALTLLCKPIRRRQFILGKFLGIVVPVVLMFIILSTVFLISIYFKVGYDAREVSRPSPAFAERLAEMQQILPGLALAFLETVVLISISVAISTRLPMLPNLMICLSIYVLGHLVPVLVHSAAGQFEIVQFFGRFLATVLPGLGYFSMEGAISTGQRVPGIYLAWATAYCALYSTMAMLLALLLFEDRDLA